jgi:hypothetical protein
VTMRGEKSQHMILCVRLIGELEKVAGRAEVGETNQGRLSEYVLAEYAESSCTEKDSKRKGRVHEEDSKHRGREEEEEGECIVEEVRARQKW